LAVRLPMPQRKRSPSCPPTNSYYYLGHFSKFIRPGAKRIIASSMRDEIMSTAFLNRDGTVAAVAMNVSDKDVPLFLWLEGKAAKVTSPAHSILTAVIPIRKSTGN
jgi:glucosylceramidase